jgi:HEAT repeat protein
MPVHAVRLTLLFLALVVPAVSQDDQGRLVRELIGQLDADEPLVRETAAEKLFEIGPAAVSELQKVARSDRTEASLRAQKLLHRIALRGRLTPNLVKCIPGIERRLAGAPDREWTRLFTSLIPAGRMIADPWEALLVRDLRQEDLEALAPDAVRGASTTSELEQVCRGILLYRLKSARPELLRILRERIDQVPPMLVSSLAYVHAREAGPVLIRLLKGDNIELKTTSAYVLSQLGIQEAIPEIQRLLKDPNPAARQVAVRALRFLKAKGSIPDLLPLLRDENREVRNQAAYTLESLEAKEAIPGIRAMLQDKDSRVVAAYALQTLGAREAVPDLIPLLKEPHFNGSAAEVLGELRAKDSIPEVLQVLRVNDYVSSTMALRALGKLGAKEALPDMVRLLKAPDARGKEVAVQALADAGAPESIPELRECLRTGDAATRAGALRAIGMILGNTAAAEVRACLKDRNELIRESAVKTLGRIDPRDAGEEILGLLRDESSRVRAAAAAVARDWALDGGVDAIKALIKDADEGLRLQAADDLCLMGCAEGARTVLEKSGGGSLSPRSLFPLNGLRHPGLAMKIRNVDTVGFRGNRNGSIVETVARLVELPVDDAELTPHERESLETSGGSYNQQPLLAAIQQLADSSAVEIILEKDRVRLVPRRDAVAFWEKWLPKER